MKILVADVLLKGKPHHDWKEGYEFCYAFRNLGHECDVFGPNSDNSELEIPNVAHKYDFILVTENYPDYSAWKWWNWSVVKTPKIFWAIDTHLVNFLPWIQSSSIDFVFFVFSSRYLFRTIDIFGKYHLSTYRYSSSPLPSFFVLVLISSNCRVRPWYPSDSKKYFSSSSNLLVFAFLNSSFILYNF